MRTNIEKEIWNKYFPNEEFDYDNFYDWSRENAFELLPLALELSEKIKKQYADEFACGFAEWIANNASDFCEANSVYGQSLKRGQWIYFKDGHKDRIVTTTELLEIYKQQINGKV